MSNKTGINNSLLKALSPHLFNTIHRESGLVSTQIIKSFEISDQMQGNNEIHFEREPGASYNPRAARIPLILIQGLKSDTQIKEEEIILAILSSSLRGETSDKEKLSLIGEHLPDYFKPLNIICSCLSKLKNNKYPKFNFEADIIAQILVCLFIDDIRHSHLITKNTSTPVINFYISNVTFYKEIAEKFLPFYLPNILRWEERNEKTLG